MEQVESQVKTKRNFSSLETESISSEFAGTKADKYLKAAQGNLAKELRIQEIKV